MNGRIMRQFFDAHSKFRCALTLLACAGLLAGAPAVAQDAAAYDKGVLWRIETAGAAPSFVFGTVHLEDKRVTTLPVPVRAAFDGARSFAMEVSPDPANIAELAARMVYRDGRSLPAVAGEALFARIVPLLANHGVPPEAARLFKPWAMVLILQTPQQDSANVLDFMLQRLAGEQGKRLHYLESVDEQVAAFEQMPEQDQLALLNHSVETYAEISGQRERLLAAYLERDLARLWKIGEEELVRRPDLEPLKRVFDQWLLFDRNMRMVERMRPQLKAGSAFIAVGALHLYGERGVLSLLAREGYRVTRIY